LFRIVTPLSSILKNRIQYNKLKKVTDYFELRNYDFDFVDNELVKFFHCDFQINHILKDESIDFIKQKLIKYKKIRFISFHIASNYYEPKLNSKNIFIGGKKSVSREQMIINSKKNFIKLKKIFPKIKFSIENNNFYNTGAYKYVTDADFISTIVNENRINFLFDISHALITTFNKKIKLDDYLLNLPMNKINQFHLSRPIFKKNYYDDSHLIPKIDFFLINLIKKYKPKYLTLEYYKNIPQLINFQKNIKMIYEK